jgi:hypothetical protein
MNTQTVSKCVAIEAGFLIVRTGAATPGALQGYRTGIIPKTIISQQSPICQERKSKPKQFIFNCSILVAIEVVLETEYYRLYEYWTPANYKTVCTRTRYLYDLPATQGPNICSTPP